MIFFCGGVLIHRVRLAGGPHADTRGPTPEQDAEPRLREPHLQIPGADADLTGARSSRRRTETRRGTYY